MGKFRKMLAGMLSAAMVVSTMTVSAFAADTNKMPTIDTNKKGSITINKYEGDDTSKPLEGVEFTIYKIAKLEQTSNPVELKYELKYESLIDGVDINSDTTYESIKDDVDNANLKEAGKATTKIDAKTQKATVTFDDLALGVYLVKETNAPSQVVNKTANFLVSVPMTNEDGDDWVYDIVANPKNATVYGGVTLIKKGTTIGTDGKTTTENLANVTFALQRKENSSWTNVGNYTTNESGIINVTGLAPGEYRFVETSLGGQNNNKGYILDGREYKFTLGTDANGTITVDANTPKDENGNIIAVNEKPELEKTVKNKDGSYDNDTDASIGSTVSWKVEATVPSNVDELETYWITDKMSNALTWKSEADAKLTIVTNPSISLEKGTDYTLTTPEDNKKGGTWTIDFTAAGKTKLATNKVKVITVIFDTLLNENAKIGKEGNLNDAELDYSNAIYPRVDPENPNNGKKPGTDKIIDEAIVYTFKMNVLKVDGKDTAKKLENVEFDLYKYNGNKDNPTEKDLKDTANSEKIGSYKTDENGEINVSGLENGTYYLVETKTIDDYNLLKEPVKVPINVEYTTKTETTIVKNENGNVESKTKVLKQTFEGGNDGNGTFTITVKNYKGFQLPTTGGMGTILFSVAGVILMIAAAFVLLRGRKKEA